MASVAVAGDAHALRHPLIFHRRLEHHAVGELVDNAALDLLPRGLARRGGVAALLKQHGAPPREVRPREEEMGGAPGGIAARASARLWRRAAPPRRPPPRGG